MAYGVGGGMSLGGDIATGAAMGGPAGAAVGGAWNLFQKYAPALGAFLPGRKRVDPAEHIRNLAMQYSTLLDPAHQAARMGAFRSGAQTGQGVAMATRDTQGAVGGLDTGQGAIRAGLADSAGSNRAQAGVAEADTQFSALIAQLVQQSLGTSMGAGLEDPSKLQNFFRALGLGRATTTGGLPKGDMSPEMLMRIIQQMGG
jgi:hypothetical protein